MGQPSVENTAERNEVVVLGAGQAGLSVGYFLSRHIAQQIEAYEQKSVAPSAAGGASEIESRTANASSIAGRHG